MPIKFVLQVKFFTKEKGLGYTPKCTIDKIEENIKDAVKDVKDFYSMKKFFAITSDPSNNTPFGVYFALKRAAEEEIDKRKKNFAEDLIRNEGFLSFRKCDDVWKKF